MADNGALHCRVILNQKLPSSTADRGRSRSGLSQPWLFHRWKLGTACHWIIAACLLKCRCAVNGEDSICGGAKREKRGSPSSFRLSIYSLPSTRLFRGLELICLYFKGNWAQMPGHSGRRRRGIGQGLEMGWDPSKTGLRGCCGLEREGWRDAKTPFFSFSTVNTDITYLTIYDTPHERSGGKEEASSLEQSTEPEKTF